MVKSKSYKTHLKVNKDHELDNSSISKRNKKSERLTIRKKMVSNYLKSSRRKSAVNAKEYYKKRFCLKAKAICAIHPSSSMVNEFMPMVWKCLLDLDLRNLLCSQPKLLQGEKKEERRKISASRKEF